MCADEGGDESRGRGGGSIQERLRIEAALTSTEQARIDAEALLALTSALEQLSLSH